MNYSDNAMKIYKKLYFDRKENPLDKDDITFLETTPEQTHKRIAEFLGIDKKEQDDFKYILNNKIFRPNTPCMIHAGLHNDNLAACFVVKLEDSMDSIIELWSITSHIYKSGAGAGFKITNLREKNSPLSTGGYASGPAAYIEVNNCVSNTLKAGGKHRRAANMGVLDYYHPDIIDLVTIKDTGKLDAFNLSVLVDSSFMNNVIYCKERYLDFNLDLISPNKLFKNKPVKTIKGMDLWKTIIDKAWRTGDPGLLFLENINIGNPFKSRELITCTNPCGEVPLFNDSACVIASINVNQKEFYPRNKKELLNFNALRPFVKLAVRFLNRMIDKTNFIHDRFKKNMLEMRPIGLGPMGFADLLVALNIEYGSEESIKLFQDLCYHINYYAMRESIDLCVGEEIKPIPMTDSEKKNFKKYLKYFGANEQDIEDFDEFGIANCTWTCIAPTGSISISADCNYSFEPLTAIIWEKELAESHEIMKFMNPEFEKWLMEYVKSLRPTTKFLEEDANEIVEKIIKNNGSLKGIKEIPEEIQKRFRVAHDIDPITKINLQAAGQRYISMGISSTCNLPNSATKEDIENIYIHAYKQGLKGITVYRDGCKDQQPMNFGKKEIPITDDLDKIIEDSKNLSDKEKEQIKKTWLEKLINLGPNPMIPMVLAEPIFGQLIKKERPIERSGKTWEVNTPHGRLFITINKDDNGDILEIFTQLGKEGGLKNLLMSTIAHQISKRIQDGTDPKRIINDLRGMKEEKFWFKLNENQKQSIGAESIIDAIGIILETHFMENRKEWETIETLPVPEALKEKDNCEYSKGEECPECGCFSLQRNTGCRGGFCTNCLYTNCG